MRSGFCEEEAEDPIERTDKGTLLGFLNAREANKRGLDLKPNSSWVFEEIKVVGNPKLKPWEAISADL